MTYTPPRGDQVALNFEIGYEIPPGFRVGLEFVKGGPPPGDTQYVFPATWHSLAFGGIAIRHAWRALTPPGFDTFGAGEPSLINLNMEVRAGGINTLAFASPRVFLWTRYLQTPGIASAQYGATRVTHGIRSVLVTGWSGMALANTARVTHHTREVAPPGWNSLATAAPRIGWSRSVGALGWDSQAFGERIIPETITVYPEGFRGAFGNATAWNWVTLARPQGFMSTGQEELRYGLARVFNLLQFIDVVDYLESGLRPPEIVGWTEIANRNRAIVPTGIDPGTFYGPQVENKARPVLPPGLHSAAIGVQMVGYALRPVELEGIESLAMSGWSAVFNAAKVLAPPGAASQAFGSAHVESNLQTIKGYSMFDSAEVGADGMVAFAIRVVDQDTRGIEPPQIELPRVDLHTMYVDAVGLDAYGTGAAFLQIHWTIIGAKSILPGPFGYPTVRNLTPELGIYGHDSQDYGDTHVRLQWRPMPIEGTSMQLFGLAKIADRKQTVRVAGADYLRIGDKLRAIREGTDPPSLQVIWFGANDNQSFNIFINNQFGEHRTNQRALRPLQFDSLGWGTAKVTANSIHIHSGIYDQYFGDPWISLRIRRVEIEGIFDAENDRPPPPRITPHTIWAVMDAPTQAKVNHPRPDLHYVNSDRGDRRPGEVFGAVRVTLQHRTIRPSWSVQMMGLGSPTLWLKRQVIEARGIHTLRFGYHLFPGDQETEQFDSTDTAVVGAARVTNHYYGPQTVKPTGLNALIWGANDIQLFNRTLPLPGFHSLQMGGSRSEPYNGYTWQSLNVGPRKPMLPVGSSMQRFGDTWVSFWVREVNPVGFDPFLSEYTPEHFKHRMRVTRVGSGTSGPPARAIAPYGLSGFGEGWPSARLAAHFIRPDGNSDQFRKGAF